jgi:predicted small integral membrane protein
VEPPGDDGRRLRPTSPAWLTVCAVVGLVGGWCVRPLLVEVEGTSRVVAWTQPVALAVVAVIVGTAAWTTWRQLQVRRERIEPHRALNRLALARASAYVGALVAGAYTGYALSWLGLVSELAGEQASRAACAALAGAVICVGGLVLERACRVRKDDDAA